jgi:tetratricopeptide (TPR) repeat protein
LNHYQESINIYKKLGKQPAYQRELACSLNNLGYVYCLLGTIDVALIYCQQGLRMRERLSRKNDVSEVAVGLSYSTLGYVYLYGGNDVEAESHLERALDTFTRANNKKGLAGCHNRFGLLHMKRENLDKALDHFKKAFEEATNIDEEAQITSLNRQGQIYALRQEYEKARDIFERAIEQAIRVHDSYQEVGSRIDLARTLAHLEEHEQSSEQIKQATIIAKQRHYNKRLGEIEKFQGDLFYQKREYQEAFRHYAKLCHFMAQYNLIEYREALHCLTSKLLMVDDTTEVVKALEILRAYWKEEGLEGPYPDFVKVCDEIGKVNL